MDKNARPKKPQVDMKVLKRVLAYVFKQYKFLFAIAMFCTVFSSFAGVYGTLFIEELINDHILPIVAAVKAGEAANYTGLLLALVKLASIYIVGIIANFACAYIMVIIAQGVLKKIRDVCATSLIL